MCFIVKILIYIKSNISYVQSEKIIFINLKLLLAPGYSCVQGYYTRLYRNITGSRDEVAITCSKESSCKAFNYNSQLEYGILCSSNDSEENSDGWEKCLIGYPGKPS